MLPFSTSLFQILNESKSSSKLYRNKGSNFTLEKKQDHNLIVQSYDTFANTISNKSPRQSCTHLPISTRKDRFKNRCEYRNMYSYNGLIDSKQYQSIKRILKTIDRWDFNIFALERFSAGYPLTYLSINIFQVHDLINYFELDISNLYRFFMTIERSYHSSNPYHNALHAADVTQAINCIVQDKKIWSHLSKVDVLCSLLSTICHDVDHPGLNNMFMNNSRHHLSSLYKRESVLENHHWAFSLSVLMETKLFSHFHTVLWKFVTSTCRSLIKATDISQQNKYIDDFNTTLPPMDLGQEESLSEEKKLLVLQIAIKCADICNPCRRWDICNCWAYLVTEEFFQQGDKEKELSLPVSPIMDRDKSKLAVVQKDFINYLVLPLFRVWDQFISSDLSRKLLSQIFSNQTMWQILASKSPEESDSLILNSIQSLYDRLQLMQVMDYTNTHELSHLQRLRLLIDANYLEKVSQSGGESEELDENQNFDPLGLYPVSDRIEEGQTKLYHQCRRGSLPLMPSNRDSIFLNNPRKNASSNQRQKLMIRRTSLQPGQVFMTSMTSTSVNRNKNNSLHLMQCGQEPSARFPTANRRKSAPVIKANLTTLFDTISCGRFGSLTSGYLYSKPLGSSRLCSFSQSHLHRFQHANSMNDIQIPQVR